MADKKAQFVVELESEMTKISKKSRWSAKEAGKLVADILLAAIFEAELPSLRYRYNDGYFGTLAKIEADNRSTDFTANQLMTIERYALLGEYAVRSYDEMRYWEQTIKNGFKDVELIFRRTDLIAFARAAGDRETLSKVFESEPTKEAPIEDYGKIIVSAMVGQYGESIRVTYEAVYDLLRRVLAWNIITDKIGSMYELDAYAYLKQRTNEIGVRIPTGQEAVDDLERISNGAVDEVKELFDYRTIQRVFDKYDVFSGKRVELKCEDTVNKSLRSYRMRNALQAIEEEIEDYGREE